MIAGAAEATVMMCTERRKMWGADGSAEESGLSWSSQLGNNFTTPRGFTACSSKTCNSKKDALHQSVCSLTSKLDQAEVVPVAFVDASALSCQHFKNFCPLNLHTFVFRKRRGWHR